ncbi:tail fiber domain-containing protein, partial [bacterium]|nr:tail fiber domain-containing protein [bacterium]
KMALRAGRSTGTQWDDANVGYYSLATGYNTTASGDYSTAMGYNFTNPNHYSLGIGYQDLDILLNPDGVSYINGGYLGLGTTTPDYRLTLPNNADNSGKGIANAWPTYSSIRWKKNIRLIDNALEKVKRLRGVYYDWKESDVHDIGLIAEEVGEVIPEVVDYEENGTDAKGLDYSRLVALLVEAIKNQQTQMEDQQESIKNQQTQMENQQESMKNQQTQMEDSQERILALEQKIKELEKK